MPTTPNELLIMEQKDVSLSGKRFPAQLDIAMYKKGLYKETDKMSDLICGNYPMVLVTSRFGIKLGFGDKNIGEVCRQNDVDAFTFLTVVNFLTEEIQVATEEVCERISVETLMHYLHNAHDYFLDFRLPHIREKLNEATSTCQPEVAFAIHKFFEEYVQEIHKHMAYEEKTVFPYVRNLMEGKEETKYKISIFRKRHEQIDKKLSDLKNILIKYYPGSGSYMLNSVLFDLFTTEEDLISHTRVENDLFTPVILSYEKKLLKK